jgi:GTP-binding protein
VVLAVNKIDHIGLTDHPTTFIPGHGRPVAISAGQGLGLGDLLDEIVSHFPT